MRGGKKKGGAYRNQRAPRKRRKGRHRALFDEEFVDAEEELYYARTLARVEQQRE